MSNKEDEEERGYMDNLCSDLNACSLEVLQTPLKVHNQNHADGDTEATISSSFALPLVVGCYQLDESEETASSLAEAVEEDDDAAAGTNEDDKNGDKNSSSSVRNGELLMFMINCNNKEQAENCGGEDLKFGSPVHRVKDTSGVLDAKWHQNRPLFYENSSSSSDNSKPSSAYMFATACASGSIDIYALQQQEQKSQNQSHHYLNRISSSSHGDDNDNGLCLSLAWDEYQHNNKENVKFSDSSDEVQTRIASSYSNGTVAIHNVSLIDPNNNNKVLQTHRWNAHTLFGCPSEVWTTCFASNKYYNTYSHTIISGGDDCKMKLWDLRLCDISTSDDDVATPTPTHTVGEREYNAGVTAVSYHPTLEHFFASGSYDEGLRLWDMRYLSSPMEKVESVGGGVWRIKWHPDDDGQKEKDEASQQQLTYKILVGAMHGGCRVLTTSLPHLQDQQQEQDQPLSIVKEFTKHKSMAYGADWIHHKIRKDGDKYDTIEAAASCSFYDRQGFIWNIT